MKLVNSEVIIEEEKNLIQSVVSKINSEKISKVFNDFFNYELIENLEFEEGDLIVHDNRCAFKLGYFGVLSFSVLIDRTGSYLGISNPINQIDENRDPAVTQVSLIDSEFIVQKEKEFLDRVADSIDIKQLSILFNNHLSNHVLTEIKFKSGHIVRYNEKISYKLEFDNKIRFDLIVDSNGNFLEFSTSGSGLSKNNEYPNSENSSDDILTKIGKDDSWNFQKGY